MKRRNHGNKPLGSPGTEYWLSLSGLEALAFEPRFPSLQRSDRYPYVVNSYPFDNP